VGRNLSFSQCGWRLLYVAAGYRIRSHVYPMRQDFAFECEWGGRDISQEWHRLAKERCVLDVAARRHFLVDVAAGCSFCAGARTSARCARTC
jgi:hypothetical protein